MHLNKEMNHQTLHKYLGKKKICATFFEQSLAVSSAITGKHCLANQFTLQFSHLPYSSNFALANFSLFPKRKLLPRNKINMLRTPRSLLTVTLNALSFRSPQ